MKYLNIAKNVPVTDSFDLVVCGAGSAGWIAAVSAARRGLKVGLIDRYGFPGGTAAASYVLPISGTYLKETCAVSKIPMEFERRLEADGNALFEMPRGHVSFDPEAYKITAEQMLTEAKVSFITNSYISDCVTEDKKITHVIIANKNGLEAIEGKVFIDATGDADLFRLIGAPIQEKSPTMQPVSLCFLLSGVDITTDLLREYVHHDGQHGHGSCHKEIREFLLGCDEIDDFCGPWFNSTVTGPNIAVNITRSGIDALDNRAYAATERKLRADMFKMVSLLRDKYPEFSKCQIAASAFNAGIRETRRIKGKYIYTGEDMKSARVLPSPVACCAHPIDIHMQKGGGQILEFLNKPALIPYDSLVCEGYGNLIAAGRCISTDDIAMASARVQATCMTMGDAAGAAAAYALHKGLDTDKLSENGFIFDDMEQLKNV